MNPTGEGILRHRADVGTYRLVAEVDPAIVEYCRALCPRHMRLNRQKFAPHITVLRESVIPNMPLWGSMEGATVPFS